MKQLLLVRHAKSSWKEPGLTDELRPLNKRGKRDGPFMAKYIHDGGLIIDALFSSPAKRAFSTSRFFAKEFGLEVSLESDLYFGSESDWLYMINELDEAVKFPAYFSHNPTITYFANSFEGELIENVPTCGIIHLVSLADNWADLDRNNTKINNYYFPKLVK